MKEAFEKIKERLEEIRTTEQFNRGKLLKENDYTGANIAHRGIVMLNDALQIVSEVEAEYMKNPMYQYAMVYAKNLVQFGVDVRENLDSAVAQSMALNQAYIRGIDDERKRIYGAEYGNGWITDRMPTEEECGGKHICGTVIPNYDEVKIAEWLKTPAED